MTFNAVRAGLYGAVIVLTIICTGMAGYFASVLIHSSLTTFVPFALFVCAASLLVFFVLLGFSLVLGHRNPISTRIELSSIGLLGIFWLCLGILMVTSAAQDADVECFASEDSTEPLSEDLAALRTDQFHAMYRVLEAFSLLNAILILGFFALLFCLAIRRHRRGDTHMWVGPVTSCAWFNNYGGGTGNVQRNNSSSSILPFFSRNETKERRDSSKPQTSTGAKLPTPIAAAHRRHDSATREAPAMQQRYTSTRTPVSASRAARQHARQESASRAVPAPNPRRQDSTSRTPPTRNTSMRRQDSTSRAAAPPVSRDNSARRQNSTSRRDGMNRSDSYGRYNRRGPSPDPSFANSSLEDYDAGYIANPYDRR
ncbi:hypothetical protein BD626DRAFT_479192 [Schizophyllum amplum]|uniref:MARVEL domain-containing protein n=1 Tax=Schizophyllum amplum TaxID=97359 RepID=A0A550CS01_9AGAR|nr:hypothetical protein BD626DRAFT_479192 [Auriculariopsis ampla]